MTLNEAIREAKRGGDESLMVDESWSAPWGPIGSISHHPPGLVSSALLRNLFANTDPDAPDEKYAPLPVYEFFTQGQLVERGTIEDLNRELRERSMRETAAEFELPPQWRDVEIEVGREPGRDAVWVGHPTEDGLEALIPTSQLPRVVRELAALMTEEQRRALIEESVRQFSDMCLITHVMPDTMVTASPRHINPDPPTYLKAIGGPGPFDQLPPFERAVCEHSGRSYEAIYRESGPGISALPVKSEPLAFLLEDLVAADE